MARREIGAERYGAAARLLEGNLARLMPGHMLRHEWRDGGRRLLAEITDAAGSSARVAFDCTTGARDAAAPPMPAGAVNEGLLSPDGSRSAFMRGHDLWLRSAAGETRLTHDGAPLFAYGALPQQSTQLFAAQRHPASHPPRQCAWSPDGRLLIGQRLDERAVEPYAFLESVPPAGSFRPIVRTVRMAMLGEAGPRQHPFLIDIAQGRVTPITAADGWTLDPLGPFWADRCTRLFLLGEAEDGRRAGLFEVPLATGVARACIVEQQGAAPVFLNAYDYQAPNIHVMADGQEAIWYSERDGAGRLYLHDLATGNCMRALYDGPGWVLDLLGVDERTRLAFATIGGSITGDDPYRRDLFALSLDGAPSLRLTDPALDHALDPALAPRWRAIAGLPAPPSPLSPDSTCFIDRASSLRQPTATHLRQTGNGESLALIATMDPEAAVAAGWQPPCRFSVKAADGVTDLWGTLWRPHGYDPASRYPLIDALYGGPQLTIAPRAFHDELGMRGAPPGRASLAALGCFVLTIDGRGTPGRDRAFRDAGYGNFADPCIDDHAAAIEQLAARHSAIDLSRVGVIGHSFGGYVAARAMLRRPDLYRVGIASAAVHNWHGFRDAYRRYLGPPDYGDGRRDKPGPDRIPLSHAALDNAALADRLRGRLLLAYGDMDENAMPASTLQFIDALTRAGKSYDLIYMPNGTHGFNLTPYFIQRCWDYFVEHLLEALPPGGFDLRNALEDLA